MFPAHHGLGHIHRPAKRHTAKGIDLAVYHLDGALGVLHEPPIPDRFLYPVMVQLVPVHKTRFGPIGARSHYDPTPHQRFAGDTSADGAEEVVVQQAVLVVGSFDAVAILCLIQ